LQISPQALYLLLHFSVFAPLAYSLEVRFNLALELQPTAALADFKRVLDDITTQFLLPTFIAGALHAGLSASLALIVEVLSSCAWATLELDAAALSLVAAASAWAVAGRWARCPTTGDPLAGFHADMHDGVGTADVDVDVACGR
jgi:hypothetical protein